MNNMSRRCSGILFLLFLTSALSEETENPTIRILLLIAQRDDVAMKYIEKAVNYVVEHDKLSVEASSLYYEYFYYNTKEVCNHLVERNLSFTNLIIVIENEYNIMAKVAAFYGVPVISFNQDYPLSDHFFMKFSPPNLDLPFLIREIVRSRQMLDFAVVYPPELKWNHKDLHRELNHQGINCLFVRLIKNKASKILKNINAIHFNNIILLGGVNLTKHDFNGSVVYLINFNEINQDADIVFKPIVHNNKLFQQIIGEEPDFVSAAFYFDVTRMGIKALSTMSKNGEMISSAQCSSNNSRIDFQTHFTQLEDPLVGDVNYDNPNRFMKYTMDIIIKNTTQPESYTIRSQLKITNTQIWESIHPKFHYRILARIKPPFVYYDQKTGRKFGYSIDMLNIMASILGFTYDLDILDNSNNSKDFIKRMLEGEYHIGLGPVYEFMRYHFPDVEYSIPYYKLVGIKFLMKNSKRDSIFTFINVLEPLVWISIISAFFINSFILWASERISPASYKNNKDKYANDPEVRDFTLKESLWFCLTSITPDGGGIVPKHVSGRLIVVTWWLFGFIILASYSANLAAFLTLSKMNTPIQNFDDLYRHMHMRFAPLFNSDVMFTLENMIRSENYTKPKFSKYPWTAKYNRLNNNTAFPKNTETALEWLFASKTATDGFAFIVDAIDARYLLMTQCNLIDVGEEENRRNLVIALPSLSILKYDINYALNTIAKKRIDVDLEKKWFDRNPYKATCVELEDDSEGVGINNFGGVFFIIFIGIAITMINMAYDYFLYKRRYRKVSAVTLVTSADNNRLKEGPETTNNNRVAKSTISNIDHTTLKF